VGDLNFRLDLGLASEEHKKALDGLAKEKIAEYSRKVVMPLLDDENWSELWKLDELHHIIEAGKVLAGFSEGKYSFAPTFKVEVFFTGYNPERTPSYCDRVLWRSMPALKDDVQQLSLMPCLDVLTSDHKPVCSTFTVKTNASVPPVAEKERESTCPVIVISDLKAKDLLSADANGKSDPYIVFRSEGVIEHDSANKGPKTNKKFGTLDPHWKDEDVPALQCQINDREALSRSSLQLVLFDWDAMNENDLLGFVALSLADLMDGSEVKFKENVICFGKHHGTIEGKIRLAWPEDGRTTVTRKKAKDESCCTLM